MFYDCMMFLLCNVLFAWILALSDAAAFCAILCQQSKIRLYLLIRFSQKFHRFLLTLMCISTINVLKQRKLLFHFVTVVILSMWYWNYILRLLLLVRVLTLFSETPYVIILICCCLCINGY